MKTYETKEVIEKKVDNIITSVSCNKCGEVKSLEGDEHDREIQSNTFQSFYCYFGYGSRYDMESWSFDLCENCLTEIVKTFKLVPSGFGEDGYLAAYPQKTFEEWKETGQINLEAGMSEEEIAENGGSIYSSDDDED